MSERPDSEFRRRVLRIATTSWSGRYVVENDPASKTNVGRSAQAGIRKGLEYTGLSETEQAIVRVIEHSAGGLVILDSDKFSGR